MLSRAAAVILTSVVSLVAFAIPGWSGVDVTPDDFDPKLHLEATDKQPEVDQPDGGAPAPVFHNDPVVTVCEPDALGTIQCYPRNPDDPDPDDAELTEGDILNAVREIGLPSLEVQIQPGTSTLVNVPTIFYTEPEQFNRSVTLLGFDVDLIATPVRYRWLHGDGTARTTTKPGKPYPSTQVTHRYRQPDEAVNPSVDVTYRVRYRVDGGAWATIDQTLQASGPTAALEVKEAAPVLTHP